MITCIYLGPHSEFDSIPMRKIPIILNGNSKMGTKSEACGILESVRAAGISGQLLPKRRGTGRSGYNSMRRDHSPLLLSLAPQLNFGGWHFFGVSMDTTS